MTSKGKKEEFRVFLDPKEAGIVHRLVDDEETRYNTASQAIRDIICDALGTNRDFKEAKKEEEGDVWDKLDEEAKK